MPIEEGVANLLNLRYCLMPCGHYISSDSMTKYISYIVQDKKGVIICPA
jgi:hypothetical protein